MAFNDDYSAHLMAPAGLLAGISPLPRQSAPAFGPSGQAVPEGGLLVGGGLQQDNNTSPQVFGGGLLGSLAEGMSNNRNSLIGMGLGLMSGDRDKGFANALEGFQAGARNDLLTNSAKAKSAQEAQALAMRAATLKKLGLDPNLAGDSATASAVIAARLKPKEAPEPGQYERLLEGIKDPAQKEAARLSLLGVKTPEPEKPVSPEQDAWNRLSDADKAAAARNKFKLTGEESGEGVPPGADPKTYREAKARAAVEREAGNVGRAETAENVIRNVDRAERAYGQLGKRGTIGPMHASSLSRTAGGVMGGPSEILRQDYEAAQKELELYQAQLRMKGQGAISQGERKLLELTLPRLDAADPSTGLTSLRMMREAAQRVRDEARASDPAARANPSVALPSGTSNEGALEELRRRGLIR